MSRSLPLYFSHSLYICYILVTSRSYFIQSDASYSYWLSRYPQTISLRSMYTFFRDSGFSGRFNCSNSLTFFSPRLLAALSQTWDLFELGKCSKVPLCTILTVYSFSCASSLPTYCNPLPDHFFCFVSGYAIPIFALFLILWRQHVQIFWQFSYLI